MVNNRKIAVIASNSFSGSDLVDLLLEDPANEVIGVGRSPEKGPCFHAYRLRRQPNFRYFQFDLNKSMPQVLDLLDSFRPEYVVNFAAQGEVGHSWKHPERWFQTNAVAVAELANALKDRDYLCRYVHISTPEVYGTCSGNVDESTPYNPSTPYAASKAAADMFLFALFKAYGFPLVMIRATNVYGARQQLYRIIPRTFIYLKTGKKIELHGGGVAVKSYIHIRDVSQGELAAMLEGRPGAIYHLSPDSGYAVRDIVRMVCELTGRDFESCAVSVGERLGQDAAYVIDSSRARAEFGWAPRVSMEEGLAKVHVWIEEYWEELKNSAHEYVHVP